MSQQFLPGALIRARGREWVVQPGSEGDVLCLRPFGGTEAETVTLLTTLEFKPPEPATFPWPDPHKPGNHDAALLLRDALQLKLRNGAGPFRSFGNIAVEPRAYQLVPLLMALRQPTVRLLIADDVGIGKTIEAGLIVRELWDRGEIRQIAVLCPPHLVEQWQKELLERFHFRATALTSSSVARIEKQLPSGSSLFEQHPIVIVSLDYIKSERHREHFLAMAPECVIVDEAHTCTTQGQGRQLRFELLQRLAADRDRHMLLLTATPHSGKDSAFYNLLSLLDPVFGNLPEASLAEQKRLREQLASHFVQRRRKDIEEWQEGKLFPRRKTREITYSLSGAWGEFFDAVQDYCLDLAQRKEREQHLSSMIWYATLAMLRCVASSPAAAEKALTTRLQGQDETHHFEEDPHLFDGQADDLLVDDLEPAAAIEEASQLKNLIHSARKLSGKDHDPKLDVLIAHLQELLKEDFRPVIFCRYIATAHYLGEHLRKAFPKRTVDVITGEYTPDEREVRVETLGESELPILVATDCLSEGVNLQHHFNAVIHYDLAWNPTRHEQREGRVDRFGQKSPEVRCTMLYGQDNPVDGFILNVILRKAEAIRRELGVLVPMPEDSQRINQALIKAALLKRKPGKGQAQQLDFLEALAPELKAVESDWQDAMEKAKANRTVFAQRRIKPEEVLPEWRKQLAILGGEADVRRFVHNACARLNAPLEPSKRHGERLLTAHLPQALKARLAQVQLDKTLNLDFQFPPVPGAMYVHRSHPLVGYLADYLLETALAGDSQLTARTAVTITADVDVITQIYLLRIRHQLTFLRQNQRRTLMAEETLALAVEGRAQPRWLEEADVLSLLAVTPSANLSAEASVREAQAALEFLDSQRERLDAIAQSRAEALLADHRRVREAAKDLGSYSVRPCLPVDVMGVYVLLPDEL